MAKGKLDKFTNLSHLLAAATDVVVSDFIQAGFFLLALNGVTLCSKGVKNR